MNSSIQNTSGSGYGSKSGGVACEVCFGGTRRAGVLTSLVSRQIPPPWILNLDFFSGCRGAVGFLSKGSNYTHCRFQRVSLSVFPRPGGDGLGQRGAVDGKLGRSASSCGRETDIPERVPGEIMLRAGKHQEQRGFETPLTFPPEACVQPTRGLPYDAADIYRGGGRGDNPL